MVVMHVENQDITRKALADSLGVKDDHFQWKGQMHKLLSTALVEHARDALKKAGQVDILVLDIGLDVGWDNLHMLDTLGHLATGTPRESGPTSCLAHELAVLGRKCKVNCALLTNYADYVGKPIAQGDAKKMLTREDLLRIFMADAIFRKSDTGVPDCATWIKGKL